MALRLALTYQQIEDGLLRTRDVLAAAEEMAEAIEWAMEADIEVPEVHDEWTARLDHAVGRYRALVGRI